MCSAHNNGIAFEVSHVSGERIVFEIDEWRISSLVSVGISWFGVVDVDGASVDSDVAIESIVGEDDVLSSSILDENSAL